MAVRSTTSYSSVSVHADLTKEQYDLYTGEIRTWTETEEYEVVDLTATDDTPVRVSRTETIAHADLTKGVAEQSKKLNSSKSIRKNTNLSAVQYHDNKDGPPCFICGAVCKDASNYRNHLLSHYYR